MNGHICSQSILSFFIFFFSKLENDLRVVALSSEIGNELVAGGG
jgi:hypothetical protein